jgi:hypothetical protein
VDEELTWYDCNVRLAYVLKLLQPPAPTADAAATRSSEAGPEESPAPAIQSDQMMTADPAQATPEARPEAAPPVTQPNDLTIDIQASAPAHGAPEAESDDAERSGPGAPEQYHWDDGFWYMRDLLDRRGDPKNRENPNPIKDWRSNADLYRAVLDYLEDVWGEVPDFKHAEKVIRPQLKNGGRSRSRSARDNYAPLCSNMLRLRVTCYQT